MADTQRPDDELHSLVDRTVTFNYRKREFRFSLTRELFSSAGVDSGTNQLLILLASALSDGHVESVVDLGCGSGTLGIALAGTFDVPLYATDRDTLAVAWTRMNAISNGLANATVDTSLGAAHPPQQSGILAVSNLPAKAGEPVLDRLMDELASLAARPESLAGVVVVRPLESWLRSRISTLGLTIVSERSSANHCSVLFRAPNSAEGDPTEGGLPLPNAFIRCERCAFEGPDGQYAAQTVFGLTEFDGLSFQTALAFDLLRTVSLQGSVLVRGCGQGHITIGAGQRAGERALLTLSERDLLALRATEANMGQQGMFPAGIKSMAEPLPVDRDEEQFDWLIVAEGPAGARGERRIDRMMKSSLRVGGKLLLTGKSTYVSRFEKLVGRQMRTVGERRLRGDRAQLFVRKR
jgi:16S rRNA G1207 methylase RsmC